MELKADSPATLEAVVEAIVRLSRLDEPQILQLVSEGRLKECFPFRVRREGEIPPDFVAADDLVEASALPLTRAARQALIQSSMSGASRPGVLARARAFVLERFQGSETDPSSNSSESKHRS